MDLETLNSLLKIGVFVGGICAVGALITETVINSRQAEVIRQMNLTIAEQQERAAVAERQVLEVRKKLAPRELSDQQQAGIAEAVAPFAGVVYQLFTYPGDDEPAALSLRIEGAIASSGWVKDLTSRGSLLGSATGIVVAANRSGTPTDIAAAETLTAALNAVGLEARSAMDALKIGVGVKIQVARKP